MKTDTLTIDEIHEVLNEHGLYVARDLSPREALAAVIGLLRANTQDDFEEEWGTRSHGIVTKHRSEHSARGMMDSFSSVLGPISTRKVVRRLVGPWEEA